MDGFVPYAPLALLATLPLAGGALIALKTSKYVKSSWFKALKKPSWYPSAPVFPVAWTILYLLMGVTFAVGVKHRADNPMVPWALAAFLVQLILNYVWSIVFFERRALKWSVVVVTALLVSVVLSTFLMYSSIGWSAAWPMLPYVFWVAFAFVLNVNIAWANK